MGQYLPIVVLMGLSIAFGGLSFAASRLLAPRRPSTAKDAPYECGIVPSREPPQRFPVGFYIVAMLFIMFDIEIVFLYPYAVQAGALGWFGLGAVLIFSAIFFLTFVYEVARGGLEWGPLARTERVDLGLRGEDGRETDMVSPDRSSSSTIRRVGLDGRNERAVIGDADTGAAA